MSFLNTLSYCWGSVGDLEPLASLAVPAVTRQHPYLLGYPAILSYPAIPPVQISTSPNPNQSKSQSGTLTLALLNPALLIHPF